MMTDHQHALWRRATLLGIFTVVWNIAEGIVSIAFGVADEALALFGFGVDSGIETISAVGVLVMVQRIRRGASDERSRFEITALRVTGWCFYALAITLTAGAVLGIATGSDPDTTLPGIIISTISLLTMWALVAAKTATGRALGSSPIVADARCNLVCVYMSLVLLASSGLVALTGIGALDAIGALGLVWFSITEGRESFEKARGIHACGCGSSCESEAGITQR